MGAILVAHSHNRIMIFMSLLGTAVMFDVDQAAPQREVIMGACLQYVSVMFLRH